MKEIEEKQIQTAHRTTIEAIKGSLLTKAKQQVNESSLQKSTKTQVLKSYSNVITWMAEQHLSRPPSKKLVTEAQTQLNEELTVIQNTLEQVTDDNGLQSEQPEALSQSLKKSTKQLCESLVDFSPSAVNTYKAKLSLYHDQLKNKKTDAHLTARVFDPESFTPDSISPMDYDYTLDIDKLYLHIKHRLAELKPGEKLNIEVEIPDRADILKKVAETGFQYKISFIALLLLLFMQLKMINKDDETRTLLAIQKLIEKDKIPLHPEDITFSIKTRRASDGKLQTILEPRPLDPNVAKWKFKNSLQTLNNTLYPPTGYKDQEEKMEEETLQQTTSSPVLVPASVPALNQH